MIEEKTSIDRLRSIALKQHGFVMATQALNAGITYAALSMLVKRERLQRMAHGVYRVPQVPYEEDARYMLAVLWTGAPEAFISHETALDLYAISDINPNEIYLTVNKGRRIARAGGEAYKVFREDINPDNLSWWHGIPIATTYKSIAQCIELGTPTYIIEQAITNGAAKGLLLPREADELHRNLEQRNMANL